MDTTDEYAEVNKVANAWTNALMNLITISTQNLIMQGSEHDKIADILVEFVCIANEAFNVIKKSEYYKTHPSYIANIGLDCYSLFFNNLLHAIVLRPDGIDVLKLFYEKMNASEKVKQLNVDLPPSNFIENMQKLRDE